MPQIKIVVTAAIGLPVPIGSAADLATSAPPRNHRPGRDGLKKVLACPSNNRAVLHSERKTG